MTLKTQTLPAEKMKIKILTVQDDIINKLKARRGQFTDMVIIYHALNYCGPNWCGVAGDGANGTYEWFHWTPNSFECSDDGWGNDAAALRFVLNRVDA